MSKDDMNQKYPLPFGWKVQKMSEVVKWGSGGTPKTTEKSYYEGGTIPWLNIGDLTDGIIKKSEKKITELGLKNSSANIIPPGTLLIAMYGASIGKLGITGIECCTNQAIAYAKELRGVTTEYMYYYMAMMKSKLISMGKGGAQPNISQTVLNDLDVIVPPPPEQIRIVSRIQELFSELDNAVETLQAIKQKLTVYRQAVMKDAFEGIIDGNKQMQFWRIDEIAKVETGATPLTSKPEYYGGNIPWITSSSLNEEFIKESSKYITELAIQETNCKVFEPYTILVAMYGEGQTRGKCSELLIRAATNQAIAAINIYNTNITFRKRSISSDISSSI